MPAARTGSRCRCRSPWAGRTSDRWVVWASVRIDGPDIPAEERLPPDLLVSGTEVHAKVRCGRRALGYVLFYGVWEFLYDKVVFFF